MKNESSKQAPKKALRKTDVNLQLVCDHCKTKKTKLGKYECKCGKGNFWVEQTN